MSGGSTRVRVVIVVDPVYTSGDDCGSGLHEWGSWWILSTRVVVIFVNPVYTSGEYCGSGLREW